MAYWYRSLIIFFADWSVDSKAQERQWVPTSQDMRLRPRKRIGEHPGGCMCNDSRHAISVASHGVTETAVEVVTIGVLSVSILQLRAMVRFAESLWLVLSILLAVTLSYWASENNDFGSPSPYSPKNWCLLWLSISEWCLGSVVTVNNPMALGLPGIHK